MPRVRPEEYWNPPALLTNWSLHSVDLEFIASKAACVGAKWCAKSPRYVSALALSDPNLIQLVRVWLELRQILRN